MEHRLPGIGVAVEDGSATGRGVTALGRERHATPDHLADEAVVLGAQIVQRGDVLARA